MVIFEQSQQILSSFVLSLLCKLYSKGSFIIYVTLRMPHFVIIIDILPVNISLHLMLVVLDGKEPNVFSPEAVPVADGLYYMMFVSHCRIHSSRH